MRIKHPFRSDVTQPLALRSGDNRSLLFRGDAIGAGPLVNSLYIRANFIRQKAARLPLINECSDLIFFCHARCIMEESSTGQ